MPALSDRRKHRAPGRRRLGRRGTVTLIEAVAVIIVIAAVVALGVWFLFFSRGGSGPGTL